MKKLERSQQGQVIAPASIAIKKEAFDNRQETAIYWLGGGAAMINSHGTNLLIDPVLEGFDLPLLIENPLPIEEVGKVDGVLITHIDNDHFSRPTLKDIREQTLSYHAPHYVAEQMQKEGLPGTGHDIYDTFSIGTMKIHLTPLATIGRTVLPNTISDIGRKRTIVAIGSTRKMARFGCRAIRNCFILNCICLIPMRSCSILRIMTGILL